MDNKDKIVQLATKHPKHFTRLIKKDSELCSYIGYNDSSQSIAELAYNAVNPDEQVICRQGNQRKFTGFFQGYRNCGPASKCTCTAEQVSQKVASAKSAYTDSKKESIQAKRKSTTIAKYGVKNVGQTKSAKAAHRATYSDPNAVATIVKKVSRTKEERYGSSTYNNSEKIKETWQSKSTEFWQEKFPDKDLESLASKEKLYELYQNHTPYEIAEQLNVHVQTVYRWLNSHNIRTPFKSSLEHEMMRAIKALGVENIVSGSRKITTNGQEIDIFLPEHNLAIEMNGVYWHHDSIPYINKHYHRNKFLDLEQQGIQLITVFSNIWDDPVKRQNLLGAIASKVNADSRDKVYARSTKLITINSNEAKQFYNQYHIQGYTPSTWHYGLTYNNQLVALMSFAKPRSGIGKARDNTVELTRFASCKRVVGAASKLIAHFVKHHAEFETIVSYSNNEWSNGAMYKALGFELESDLLPSYFYFDPKTKKCYHRYNFAKHKLVKQGYDKNKSEAVIQKERGFLRIWDCGKRTWVLNVR